MESKQYQNRGGGNYNNRLLQTQSNSKNKTFEELAKEVKDNIFKDNFDEILRMSKATKLDKLLESIEMFAGRSKDNSQQNFQKELGADVTKSQLRNVYDKAKKARNMNELKLIRPNLAYIAGKDKSKEVQKFLAFLDFLIKSVQNDEQVKEFQTFFESVVAYHRFYGKDN